MISRFQFAVIGFGVTLIVTIAGTFVSPSLSFWEHLSIGYLSGTAALALISGVEWALGS